MNLDALSYDKEKSITQQLVELDNQRPGLLKGFDCNICLNRGFITKYNAEKDLSYIVDCECVKTRKSLKMQNRVEWVNCYRINYAILKP